MLSLLVRCISRHNFKYSSLIGNLGRLAINLLQYDYSILAQDYFALLSTYYSLI